MTLTETGFSRLKGMRNQSYYLHRLLAEINENNEEVMPQEYRYLNNAFDIFDTILYGADPARQYSGDTSMDLNDFYFFFSCANEILTDVKSKEELREKFDTYKDTLKLVADKKEIPMESKQQALNVRDFFEQYYNILSRKRDFMVN